MKPILLILALFNLLSASAQQSITPADIATGKKLFDLSFTPGQAGFNADCIFNWQFDKENARIN